MSSPNSRKTYFSTIVPFWYLVIVILKAHEVRALGVVVARVAAVAPVLRMRWCVIVIPDTATTTGLVISSQAAHAVACAAARAATAAGPAARVVGALGARAGHRTRAALVGQRRVVHLVVLGLHGEQRLQVLCDDSVRMCMREKVT